MIKVILWDIDGTLLNFKMAESYAIKKCFEIFKLGECTDEMLKRYSKINNIWWNRLELGLISKKEVLEGRFKEFFKQEGISDDIVEEFNNEYLLRLGDKIFYNDNGYELVSELKGKVKQYAVTNGTAVAQHRKLEKSGLDKLLDNIFISDEIGFQKPDIRFFNKVFENIGEYSKEEIMIVGDSLTSDIKGGNNSGIVCCFYNPEKKSYTDALRIDYMIENLTQIKDIL